MVNIGTDDSVYIATDQGCIQVEAHILHRHIVIGESIVFHHRFDKIFIVDSARIADDFAFQVFGTGNVAGFHRHDNVKRMLHNRTENSDRNILICCSRDDVWLVVETGIRLSGRCHRDGIICIGRELYMYIQSFFRIVSFFNGSVDKGMHRIRIPVKDNAEIFKVTVGCCAFSSF